MTKAEKLQGRLRAAEAKKDERLVEYRDPKDLIPWDEFTFPESDSNSTDFDTLERSIMESGNVHDPLQIVRENGKYLILAGRHRWEIATKLGIKVPTIQRDIPKKHWRRFVILDNLARRQLKPEIRDALLCEVWGEKPEEQPRDEDGKFDRVTKCDTVGEDKKPDRMKLSRARKRIQQKRKKLEEAGIDTSKKSPLEVVTTKVEDSKDPDKRSKLKSEAKVALNPDHYKTTRDILEKTADVCAAHYGKEVVVRVLKDLADRYNK
jgi:hypothetical protein